MSEEFGQVDHEERIFWDHAFHVAFEQICPKSTYSVPFAAAQDAAFVADEALRARRLRFQP